MSEIVIPIEAVRCLEVLLWFVGAICAGIFAVGLFILLGGE